MKQLVLLLVYCILPQPLISAALSGQSGHELSFAAIRENARLGQLGDLLSNSEGSVDDEDLEQSLMGAMEGNQVDAVDKLIKHLKEKKNNRQMQNFMDRFIKNACGADNSEVIRYIKANSIYELDGLTVFTLGGIKIADTLLEMHSFPISAVLFYASAGDNLDVVEHLATKGALDNIFERYIALRGCFDYDRLLSPRVFQYLVTTAGQISLQDLADILMIEDPDGKGDLTDLQNKLLWSAFKQQGWKVYNFIHMAQDFDFGRSLMKGIRANFGNHGKERAFYRLDLFVREYLEALLPLKNGQSIKEACSELVEGASSKMRRLYRRHSKTWTEIDTFNFFRELWRNPSQAYQMLKDLERNKRNSKRFRPRFPSFFK